MIHWIRQRGRVVLALLLASAVLSASAGPAAAIDCTTTDIHGEERDCTATEEFRECWGHSIDAYLQCIEQDPPQSWWEQIKYQAVLAGCQVLAGVDQLDCTTSLPVDLFL